MAASKVFLNKSYLISPGLDKAIQASFEQFFQDILENRAWLKTHLHQVLSVEQYGSPPQFGKIKGDESLY
ncbi:MAG: hypothetical protein JRI80_15130, partial [Deltaproteobacteria bacterium]|nr:hypothetical protein [Deltaproteobacteria bacterium]